MKGFLLDENLPKSLTFTENFVHVTDLGKRKTDAEIWQYAKLNDLVIITKDTDFYDRIILEGPPPKITWLSSLPCYYSLPLAGNPQKENWNLSTFIALVGLA